MGFNNFRHNVLLRIVIMALTIFLLAYLIYKGQDITIIFLIFILLGLEINSMLKFLEKTNNDFVSFLNSIKYDDLTSHYPTDGSGSASDLLNQEFNKVIAKFKEIRAEKEAHYQYLKTIVQHVGIGLITFNRGGEVQIMNTAAKRLFKVSQLKNINDLRSLSEPLVESFFRLQTGGRDLVKISYKGDEIQLAIYAIELTLTGEEFKLISVQNIQSELEEKEMEAWQNLIRVLTHEIMNSITPISSLASSVEGELREQLDNSQEVNEIHNSDIEDLHQAVQTIHKRSDGLIRFVSDFRSLTHIPTPNLGMEKVKDLFDHVVTLMKSEVQEKEIDLKVSISPPDMIVNIDKELIDQVLINLVKNAVQSFDEEEDRKIELMAYHNEKSRPEILVRDNGSGIEEEALSKIFIPFFTTKKSGSGIGLSLTKQIMRKHKGNISVKSELGEGTEFVLKF